MEAVDPATMGSGMVQDALTRIKALLEPLFDTAADAVLLMDGLRFVDCNPTALRMFACRSKADVIGQTPIGFSPALQPDGASSSERASQLAAAAAEGAPQQFEWRHRRSDGTEFDVEVRLNRVIVDGAAFLIAIVRDVSARKQAEAELRDKERFLDRLIDNLPGLFYVYDSDLHLRRWNKNVETVTGLVPEQLRGAMLGRNVAGDEVRQNVQSIARQALQQGSAIELAEVEISNENGSSVPYVLSAVPVESKDGPLLVAVGMSLAARVKAEQALALSEQIYRELFNATNDALLICDAGGRVLDVNERGRVMFKMDVVQSCSSSLEDWSLGEPPYSRREALEKIRRALKEEPVVFDWRSKRSDGTLFWTEIAMRAFRIAGDERVIASVRDITERKLTTLERERLMTELQAANQAKDQFLAVLSHELRNPLAAIQAGASVLRHVDDDLSEPRAAHALDVIERNVKRQARLVNDLLDLSRVARGKVTLQRTSVQLSELVLSAVDSYRAEAARAEVSVEARAEPGLWINGDPDRIQQIVLNLVDNAIKFTPKGGRVRISVASKAGLGCIVVEDTGIGFEASRLPYLFEMFGQGEGAPRKTGGLGIGLTLVKTFAELHGGRVNAESAGPNRGSRFTVELPLSAGPTTEKGKTAMHSGVPPVKLLLIEDNADTRELLAAALAQFSYEVLSAESAEEALDMLARGHVDVILSDIGLPGMDGYEFLQNARRLPSAAGAVAFALTGFGQRADVRRAHDAGYAEHFVKPLDVEEIDRRIRSRLRGNPIANGV